MGQTHAAVLGSLAARGSCGARFRPVRNNSRPLGVSEESISTAKRTLWVAHPLSSPSLAHTTAGYTAVFLQTMTGQVRGLNGAN